MRYTVILILIVLSVVAACRKDANQNCFSEKFNYTASANKKIDTFTNAQAQIFFFQINNGSNIVFQYERNEKYCKNIADAGLTEYFVFEIPENVTSFLYTDDALKDIQCYYRKVCFCDDVDALPLLKGTVQGQKISAKEWGVQISIEVPGSSRTITVNKNFSME